MTLRATYTPSQTDVDFFARNAAGQWWNTSGTPAFENYNSANLASYRITATETPAGSGLYQGTEPMAAAEFELRVRAATLADSYIVAGPAEADDIDGFTTQQAMKLLLAVNVGKVAATATSAVFRAADDSKARVTATVDASGNRTAITADVT